VLPPLRSATLRASLAGWLCLAALPAPAQETFRWVTGDPHVHATAWDCDVSHSPEQLAELQERHHLDVVSALLWGIGYERDRPWFTGRDHPVSTAEHVLHFDVEVSHFEPERGGHLILLGLRELDFFDAGATSLSGVPVVDWASGQDPGVTIGMAHGFKWPADGSFPRLDTWGRPFELPVHAARGRIHFLSTEEPGETVVDPGTWKLWKSLQNAGLRVTLMGASDYPCIAHSFDGDVLRNHALIRGPLSYAAWLEAIRAGRVVVASGDRESLNLEVAGARLGEEARLGAGLPATIVVEANLAGAADVEILGNGRPVLTLPLPAGHARVVTEIALESSAWLVARSPRAVTNPVYALVDGRPIRASAEDACYLVRYVDYLADSVARGSINMHGSRDAALAAYAEARRTLEARFLESGGSECR